MDDAGLRLDDLDRLVCVDVVRREVDASAWLGVLSDWHRPAAAAVVRHWQGVLSSPTVGRDAAYWVRHIRRAASCLTAPTVGVRRARGVLAWHHPADVLLEYPVCGICWVGDAAGGLGGTYLCRTSLFNLGCGADWVRDPDGLRCVTPLGGAAEEIVAHVLHRVAVEDGGGAR